MAGPVNHRPEHDARSRGGALIVSGLEKCYPNRGRLTPVLTDVDLAIPPGQFVSVVGESGCGKTTLIRILHGLIPRDAGSVSIDGAEVDEPANDRAFVFQGDALLPWRRIIDNVALGLEFQGLGKSERHGRARELIARVGLGGYEDHYPHQISGGMRQRVNLARAFAVDPRVLLMDEPFAALDAQTREAMQAELLHIWSQDSKTVIFVTHQIDEAVYLSDRVVLLGGAPSTVTHIIDTELPRPRSLAIKTTPEFQLKVEEVREGLGHGVGEIASQVGSPRSVTHNC